MKLLSSIIILAGLAAATSGAMAQSSPNGTPVAVPGQGPGGSGSQSGGGTTMQSGAAGQAPIPGSVSTDPTSPANTTGQPAGDKPAQ